MSSSQENRTVKEIYSEERKRSVVLFQRPSGTFGFREDYYYANEFAQGWAGDDSSPVYDILETAQREARARVDWLIEPGSREQEFEQEVGNAEES